MTPARITYHALSVAVSLTICVGLAAAHHGERGTDWVAVVAFTGAVLLILGSLNALHRDKP